MTVLYLKGKRVDVDAAHDVDADDAPAFGAAHYEPAGPRFAANVEWVRFC